MKFFAVFAALLAVACGAQSTWTLEQLSTAIQSPATNPAVLPYLEQALNEMMAALFAGEQVQAVAVTIPSVNLSTWTLPQLSAALQNPNTDPALVPYLEAALNQMMEALMTGQQVDVVTVAVPAFDVTSWTLQEIDAALSSPTTNPALLPYLEHALNEIMEALISGEQLESVAIATPVGLLPVESPVPAPVVVPNPVETPVLPAPVETPAASSPLVQIIVNIKQQGAGPVTPGGAAAPVPEIQPTPVIVVDEAPVAAEPVVVVDQTPIVAEPVVVVDQTPEFNPIDAVPVPGIVLPTPVVIAPHPAVVGPIV